MNKNKKPLRLKIGGQIYRVKYSKRVLSDSNKELFGEINYNSKLIRIREELNPLEEFNTVIHECLHAICDDRDIPQAEKMINGLANGLTSLFRDNPKLLEYLR